jgi:hypothetical protein
MFCTNVELKSLLATCFTIALRLDIDFLFWSCFDIELKFLPTLFDNCFCCNNKATTGHECYNGMLSFQLQIISSEYNYNTIQDVTKQANPKTPLGPVKEGMPSDVPGSHRS